MENLIRKFVAGTCCACLLLACGDPLKDAQNLDEPRVLGVRIDGGAGSSRVTPGVDLQVDLLLAGPAGPVEAEVAFAVCVGAPSDRGVPTCAGDPFLEGTALSSDLPISVEVPSGVEEGARVIVLGVACRDSGPTLSDDPLDWACATGDAPLRFSFESSVASQDETYRNPDLSEIDVAVSGTPLEPDGPNAAPTCDAAAITVAADQKHEVRIDLGSASTETGEGLQVSHFSTSGEFERQFTFLDAGQTAFSLAFEAGSADEAAKQYLVVRDAYGGVSWVSFGFCQR